MIRSSKDICVICEGPGSYDAIVQERGRGGALSEAEQGCKQVRLQLPDRLRCTDGWGARRLALKHR